MAEPIWATSYVDLLPQLDCSACAGPEQTRVLSSVCLKTCNQKLLKETNSAEAFFTRARAWKHEKSQQAAQNALQDLTQALLLKPDWGEAYLERAQLYFAQKAYAEAIADYTQAIQALPEHVEIIYLRALALSAQKNFEAALVDCDALIAHNPFEPWDVYSYPQTALKTHQLILLQDTIHILGYGQFFYKVYTLRAQIKQEKGKLGVIAPETLKALKLLKFQPVKQKSFPICADFNDTDCSK